MNFELKIRKTSDVAVVGVSGKVTIGEGATTVGTTIRQMASAGEKKILLDLAGLTYMDSSGIGALVSSFATVRHLGGQLKLCNLTDRVKDLLLITKLYTIFEVYENEAAAFESFASYPLAAPTGV